MPHSLSLTASPGVNSSLWYFQGNQIYVCKHAHTHIHAEFRIAWEYIFFLNKFDTLDILPQRNQEIFRCFAMFSGWLRLRLMYEYFLNVLIT